MPQQVSKRLLVLVLIALTLLTPALATARPHHETGALSAVERPEAGPSLFSQLRSLLSVLWAETGSILEPNGTTATSSGTNGDNGSGLEPDGHH